MFVHQTAETDGKPDIFREVGGLPLIRYASRGGGGEEGSTLMHTNAYKGGGGSDHDQKYAFCT